MLKSMLINKDFQTWHLIASQSESHVRKSLLTSMEFNMDFTQQTQALLICYNGSCFGPIHHTMVSWKCTSLVLPYFIKRFQ